jgi:hypothetical protein
MDNQQEETAMSPYLVLLVAFYVILLTETLRELSCADAVSDSFLKDMHGEPREWPKPGEGG